MKLRELLRSPLWVLALLTGAKSFAANPVIGSPWLNARGLHRSRVWLAGLMADARRRWLGRHVSAGDRAAFARDGFVVRENFLPPDQFQALRKEVFGTDWDVREMRQGCAVTRRVPLDAAHLSGQPTLRRLVDDVELIGLIRYVAGAGGRPLFSLQAVVVDGVEQREDPQAHVHSDTFQSTAKAWLFLQDVGPEDGPFAYVPGSHRRTPARLAWERKQSIGARDHSLPYHARGSFRAVADDLDEIGLPPPRPMTVRANTLVVADTFGFHARTPSAGPTCRVELYASLRRNPFLPWIGLDPLSLPWVRERTGQISIEALQLLKRFGMAKMPWRPVGRMRVDAPGNSHCP